MNNLKETPERHIAERVDNLMYKGCESHWHCIKCGEYVAFHCYTKSEFEKLCCGCHKIKCDGCEYKKGVIN